MGRIVAGIYLVWKILVKVVLTIVILQITFNSIRRSFRFINSSVELTWKKGDSPNVDLDH